MHRGREWGVEPGHVSWGREVVRVGLPKAGMTAEPRTEGISHPASQGRACRSEGLPNGEARAPTRETLIRPALSGGEVRPRQEALGVLQGLDRCMAGPCGCEGGAR